VPPMTAARVLDWEFWHLADQLHELDERLDRLMASEPLPLPGTADLYQLADMLFVQADALRAAQDVIVELLDTVPIDKLYAEVSLDTAIKLIESVSPSSMGLTW